MSSTLAFALPGRCMSHLNGGMGPFLKQSRVVHDAVRDAKVGHLVELLGPDRLERGTVILKNNAEPDKRPNMSPSSNIP